MLVSNHRMRNVWWHTALNAFRADGKKRLGKSYPALSGIHEDLLGEATVSLTELLQRKPATAPASWFEPGAPPADDVLRFRRLAFTVLDRRVADHFRSHYRNWVASQLEREQHELLADDAPGPAAKLDLRRAALAVAALVASLSEEDQALIEQAVMRDTASPMSPRDRQRLCRLRVDLTHSLRNKLRHEPMDVLALF